MSHAPYRLIRTGVLAEDRRRYVLPLRETYCFGSGRTFRSESSSKIATKTVRPNSSLSLSRILASLDRRSNSPILDLKSLYTFSASGMNSSQSFRHPSTVDAISCAIAFLRSASVFIFIECFKTLFHDVKDHSIKFLADAFHANFCHEIEFSWTIPAIKVWAICFDPHLPHIPGDFIPERVIHAAGSAGSTHKSLPPL
jgi:hypothetical protein